jgi:hypothetical protein
LIVKCLTEALSAVLNSNSNVVIAESLPMDHPTRNSSVILPEEKEEDLLDPILRRWIRSWSSIVKNGWQNRVVEV